MSLRETDLHASCVAIGGRGVLIMGASGTGKSSLALHLMAIGAELVSDDITHISVQDGNLIASCPPALSGLIEARGVGILRTEALAQAKLVLAVDLDRDETERLPPRRNLRVLGTDLDLVLRSTNSHFPAALRCYLIWGRQD